MAALRFPISNRHAEVLLALEKSSSAELAARQLGLTPSTLTREFQWLEKVTGAVAKIGGRWQITARGKRLNVLTLAYLEACNSVLFDTASTRISVVGIPALLLAAKPGAMEATKRWGSVALRPEGGATSGIELGSDIVISDYRPIEEGLVRCIGEVLLVAARSIHSVSSVPLPLDNSSPAIQIAFQRLLANTADGCFWIPEIFLGSEIRRAEGQTPVRVPIYLWRSYHSDILSLVASELTQVLPQTMPGLVPVGGDG